MKISIITVAFNEINGVENTIKSVLGQTYSDIEYIVIDGGSTDGTAEVIAKYADKLSYWVSERDGGIYFGMNKGLGKCSGDYVMFCNAGDELAANDVVEKLVQAVHASSSPDLVFGDCIDILDGEHYVRKAHGPHFIPYGMPASHEALLYRLALVRELGLCFDTSYRIAADYKFTYRFVNAARRFQRIDVPIVIFAEGGVSTANKWRGLSESCRVRKEVSGLRLLRRFFIWLVQVAILMVAQYAAPLYRTLRLTKNRGRSSK